MVQLRGDGDVDRAGNAVGQIVERYEALVAVGIHKDAKLIDLWRSLEIAERASIHFPRITALPGRLKAGCADNALLTSDACNNAFAPR